jgi:endonuclease VIII
VVSAGKHLLIRVEGGLTLHSHLRMEGSWRVHRTPSSQPATLTAHTVRAVLGNREWTAVGHRLGMLDLVATADEAGLVGHLGPDLLGPGWDAAAAVQRIGADPDRPIGEALLDQRVLAGLGTFYVCETLFLRGITPWTPVRAAGDLGAVVDLAHRLITANRDRAVQVTTGDARPGRQQWVHARSGRPCRRCGTTIRVASIGQAPADRVAFYCPACQPGPAPTDDGRRQRPLGAVRRAASGRGPGRPGTAYRR